MTDVLDHDFLETAERANKLVLEGATVFQKFTCEHCGSRQTMPTPNAFYCEGKCEECNGVTNIFARGCNYVLVQAFNDPESAIAALDGILTKRGDA
jgi:hypothetical protein